MFHMKCFREGAAMTVIVLYILIQNIDVHLMVALKEKSVNHHIVEIFQWIGVNFKLLVQDGNAQEWLDQIWAIGLD